MSSVRFLVYTRPDCPYCDKAKALINECGFSYEEREYVTEDQRSDFKALMGVNTFPLIIDRLAGQWVGGYSELVDYSADLF